MQNEPDNEIPPTVEELMDLCEQFRQQIETLRQANADLRSQLSVALASNHTPLLRFGTGTKDACVLNARCVQALTLEEGVTLGSPPMPSGKWQVMVDERPVSEHLALDEALTTLRVIEKQWINALEPPE